MTVVHRCDLDGCGELIEVGQDAIEVSIVRFGLDGTNAATAQHVRHYHADCYPLPLPDPTTDPVRRQQ